MGEDVYPDTLYNQKSLGKRKAKDIAKEEEGRGGRGSRQLRIPSSSQSVGSVVVTDVTDQ